MEFMFSPLLMPIHLCIYRLLKLAKSDIEKKEQLDLEHSGAFIFSFLTGRHDKEHFKDGINKRQVWGALKCKMPASLNNKWQV